ncbi:MAG: hypothetical protein DCC68_17390 [Planctomycetota bacterium]|nr:MAG: hypothetical protein DCC68_17390 [Planctomycetota bacterium]
MRVYRVLTAVCLAGLMAGAPRAQQGDASTDGDAASDYEALVRGPVHEAFAEPVDLNATAGVTISKEPPETIEEIPPAEKPEGAVWIPGYWSWDDEREDFIWVSGVWRVPPSGQRWVAGYWTQADDGFRWVGGFWTAADATEISYLPEPPPTQEAGPTSDPPSAEHFWVPGCWIYQDYRYAWRPGYWARSHEDWVWIPHRYVWTPRGAIFTAGFWDYFPLVRRGFLFSPVYFHRPIYRDRGFYYTPSVAINLGGLHLHLFARPRYHHYFFGDYYHSRYDRLGFYPWYAYRSWGGYDPLFQFYWTRYGRHGRDWEDRIRDRYRYFRENEDARPAHTFAELQRRLERRGDRDREDVIAASLREAARDPRFTATRLERIAEDQRRDLAREVGQRQRTIAERRSEVERGERVAARPRGETDRPREAAPTLRLPEDPRTARRPDRADGGPTARPDERDEPRDRDSQRADRPAGRPDRDAQPPQRRPDRPDRPERDARRDARPDRPAVGPETRPQRPEAQPQRPAGEQPGARPGQPEARPQPRPERPRPRPDVRPGRPERAEQPRRESPSVERPEPRAERRQPRAQQPQPRVERPQPRAEQPQPRVERPQPRASQGPQTRAERPQPRVAERPQPRPQPRVERPQPRVERPQPRVERPQPQSRPQPRAERPQPRAERAPSRPERGGGRSSDDRGRGRGRGGD